MYDSMVKHIHIDYEDKEHEKLVVIKQRRGLTWKEMLMKVAEVLK